MIEKIEGGVRVTAPMLISNARTLLEGGRAFLSDVTASSPVVLDLSAVAEADSSALSVIFALLRTARERDIELRIAHPPASLLSLAGLYGLSGSLPLA